MAEAEKDFLDAILKRPDDDAPRLAHARWLRERGDPRGEFILAQCEWERALPTADDWRAAVQHVSSGRDRKEKELFEWQRDLLDRHGREWAAPLHALGALDVAFRRGFPSKLVMGAESFVRNGEQALQAAPTARALELHWGGDTAPPPEVLRPVFQSPALERVESLALVGRWGHRSAHHLAGSPHLGNLRTLDVSYTGVGGGPGAHELLNSPRLPRLESLDLSGNSLGREGAMLINLMVPDPPPALRRLSLQDTGLDGAAAKLLADTPALRDLRRLDLTGNALPEGAIQAVLNSPELKNTILDVDTRHLPKHTQKTLERKLDARRRRLPGPGGPAGPG